MPKPETKAGRTISRATLARLRAARDVIDELCGMGDSYDAEEDGDQMTEKAAHDIIEPVTEAPDIQAAEGDIQPHSNPAGPVIPPTERLSMEIDLLRAELDSLEV
jgi:hypothetical protein